MNRFRELSFLPLLVVLPMGQLSGCNAEKNAYQPPPPPEVIVAVPLKQTVSDYFLETGTTEAVETVDLRARVSGILETADFVPGQWILADNDDPADYPPPPKTIDGTIPPPIKVGQVIMTIEDAEYQANVASAQAALQSAKVSENRFQTEYNRQLDLQARNATTDYDVVLAKAQLDSAKADVAAKQAALNQSELTLSYCQIKATARGRIGDQLVKPGNLVGDIEKTHLTTIVNYTPIYANFNINERAYLSLRANAEKRAGEDIPVFLRLSNETKFEHEGQFEFADLDIDQSTGTYKLRAIFKNEDLKIVPGLFVEVKVPLQDIPDALLLPESAVLADQTGKYVLVVDDKNTVQRKPVTVGPQQEEMVVISSGIEASDKIIIQGLLRARPGAVVAPKNIETALTLNVGEDTQSEPETSN
jgi:RND family efflux transporter MFP subunit